MTSGSRDMSSRETEAAAAEVKAIRGGSCYKTISGEHGGKSAAQLSNRQLQENINCAGDSRRLAELVFLVDKGVDMQSIVASVRQEETRHSRMIVSFLINQQERARRGQATAQPAAPKQVPQQVVRTPARQTTSGVASMLFSHGN